MLRKKQKNTRHTHRGHFKKKPTKQKFLRPIPMKLDRYNNNPSGRTTVFSMLCLRETAAATALSVSCILQLYRPRNSPNRIICFQIKSGCCVGNEIYCPPPQLIEATCSPLQSTESRQKPLRPRVGTIPPFSNRQQFDPPNLEWH